MLRLTLPLAFVLILGSPHAHSATPRSRAVQEEKIREVIFRDLIPESESPSKKANERAKLRESKEEPSPFKAYYLSVNDKDPSPALLKRFAGHRPPIKKLSDSYLDMKSEDPKTRGYWVRDKKTKEIGLIYSVSEIVWLGRNRARLKGGYFGGGLFATMDDYTLKRRGKPGQSFT